MCRYPCVCTDRYAGLNNHTFFQWGRPSNIMGFKAEDGNRPSPPKSVEEMTNTMSKHLAEDLLQVKAKEGNAESQRMYKEVSRFYVVDNRYEKNGHSYWHAH